MPRKEEEEEEEEEESATPLAELRANAKFTQKELAEAAETSQTTISTVELMRSRYGKADTSRPPSLSSDKMWALIGALNTRLTENEKITKLRQVSEFAAILDWEVSRGERILKPRGLSVANRLRLAAQEATQHEGSELLSLSMVAM